ncbi:ABC transporter ATP-binding protein [Natronospora cellulosivora (SeqCode)]
MNEKEAIISVKDLRMTYDGEKDVLKGINFKVYSGEIIGYIGPNGAGKSTTVRILLGIINKFQGEVRVFGHDVSADEVKYKKRVGYLPESGTIYENLYAKDYFAFLSGMYGMEESEIDRKARNLMAIFGIEDVYENPISSYSKGMKQKVLIIATLLHNPDLIFLDEPLRGLDVYSVQILKEILSKLVKEGKTIFYSSHIIEVVEKMSSRILLLNNGQLMADKNVEELKKESKEGTLEGVFNQITGYRDHKKLANEFLATIRG